jgi:hypothetical protein
MVSAPLAPPWVHRVVDFLLKVPQLPLSCSQDRGALHVPTSLDRPYKASCQLSKLDVATMLLDVFQELETLKID